MALELNGTTGVSLVQDGVVTAADLASGAITSAALPTGSVLQVKSTTKENSFSTTSTSFVDITGLSVDITPTSASSDILVILNISCSDNLGTLNNEVRILQNGSNIHGINHQVRVQNPGHMNNSSFTKLVSPATTDTLTYKAQIASESASYTAYVNIRGAGTYEAASSITVMEIAG